MNVNFLETKEQIAFSLEEMYDNFGYSKYKMNKFEPYSFYMQNENFLNDNRVLTFYNPNGKLVALKPDITMSIVKNCFNHQEKNHKIYYNESVFRVPKGQEEFKEIHQIGVEYIGILDTYTTMEILNLAYKSLEKMNDDFVLSFSNIAILLYLFEELQLSSMQIHQITLYLQQKNIHDLNKYLKQENIQDDNIFIQLLELESEPKKAIASLYKIFAQNETVQQDILVLETVTTILENITKEHKIQIDFSYIPSIEYYNELVFVGYIEKLATPILIGGRYDNLLQKMNIHSKSALGFAVNLSLLHHFKREKDVLQIPYETNQTQNFEQIEALLQKANVLCDEGQKFSINQL